MEKWKRREAKLRKRRGLDMVVSNRSIKTVIVPTIFRKGSDASNKGGARAVTGRSTQ